MRKKGIAIVLEVKLDDFKSVITLVNKIKDVAEKLNHHPNLHIHDYNELQIEIYTHEKNEITEKDFELAKEIEKIIYKQV
jgi:4a-hydroxytetrahydrobiopterin dehydratase